MKLKNVKVGMRVFVKDIDNSWAINSFKGATAEVWEIDAEGCLVTVLLQDTTGNTDWVRSKDIRKLREGEI